MNVEAVVKVMNFHALLRVDQSGRQALMYGTMEEELSHMMQIIQSNRNLRMDKLIKLPNPKNPVLRIYIGSDLGFCGSVNTSVSSVMNKDEGTEKIVIGRKLRKPKEVSLYLSREEYLANFSLVREYLVRAVRESPWSAVELVYNHYYNVSNVSQIVKRIYPMEFDTEVELEEQNDWDDFEIEGDPEQLLEDMTISCLVYEVRIAAASAYAAENIMRQNATTESLKKLDEMATEERRVMRKERNQSSFRKTIDNFSKQKSLKANSQKG